MFVLIFSVVSVFFMFFSPLFQIFWTCDSSTSFWHYCIFNNIRNILESGIILFYYFMLGYLLMSVKNHGLYICLSVTYTNTFVNIYILKGYLFLVYINTYYLVYTYITFVFNVCVHSHKYFPGAFEMKFSFFILFFF